MFESIPGPYQKRLEPATRRAEKVLSFFWRLELYVRTGTSPHKHHIAYLIASLSCNQALSYDARLVPPGVLAGEAARLHDASWDFLELLLASTLDSDTRRQACLPGPIGGISYRPPCFENLAPRFLSTHCNLSPRLRGLSLELGIALPDLQLRR